MKPTDDDRMFAAVELTLAMLASVGPDKIKPLDWWIRARSALETAAACAGSWSEMVSEMGRKLQVEALQLKSTTRLAAVEPLAADDFETFRRLCEQQSLYVVAQAQLKRKEERDAA